MAGEESTSNCGSGSSMMKTIQSLNIHQSSKIDVVKFNGTNNFDLWRCEMLDALIAQSFEDILELQEKPAEVKQKV